MWRLAVSWVCAVIVVLGAMSAHADGTFVWRGYERLSEPSQKGIIVYDEGVEDLFLQVKYEGSAAEFGWIVPVPSKPEVRQILFSCFHLLDQKLGKRLDPGLLARINRLFTIYTWDGDSAVSIAGERDIGDYRVTVLQGQDGEALRAWFDEHGFQVPENGEEVLNRYIEKGWWFVAAKIRPGARTEAKEALLRRGELAPLHLRFESEVPVYPLYISSLNKGGGEIQLYVFSRELVACPSLMPEKEDFISTRELVTALAGQRQEPGLQQTEPVSFFQTDGLPPSLRYEIQRPVPGPWYCSRFQKSVQYDAIRNDWVFEANPALIENVVRLSRGIQNELYNLDAIGGVEPRTRAEKHGWPRFKYHRMRKKFGKGLPSVPAFEVPPRLPPPVPLNDLLKLVRSDSKSPPATNSEFGFGGQREDGDFGGFGDDDLFGLRRPAPPPALKELERWLNEGELNRELRRYLIRYGGAHECLRFCRNKDDRQTILQAFEKQRRKLSSPWAEDASAPEYPWHREQLQKWLKTPDMTIFEAGYFRSYLRPPARGIPHHHPYNPASLPLSKRYATSRARFVDTETGRQTSSPKSPQAEALRLLARYRDPLAFEVLADWLDHPHVNVRRSALNIMVCSLGNSLAGSAYYGTLYPYIHASALDHRERNIRLLRPLLNDPDHLCQLAAATVLGWFGDSESAPVFQEYIAEMLRMNKAVGGNVKLPNRKETWTPEQAAFYRRIQLANTALMAAANDPSLAYAQLIAQVLDTSGETMRWVLKYSLVVAVAAHIDHPKVVERLLRRHGISSLFPILKVVGEEVAAWLDSEIARTGDMDLKFKRLMISVHRSELSPEQAEKRFLKLLEDPDTTIRHVASIAWMRWHGNEAKNGRYNSRGSRAADRNREAILRFLSRRREGLLQPSDRYDHWARTFLVQSTKQEAFSAQALELLREIVAHHENEYGRANRAPLAAPILERVVLADLAGPAAIREHASRLPRQSPDAEWCRRILKWETAENTERRRSDKEYQEQKKAFQRALADDVSLHPRTVSYGRRCFGIHHSPTAMELAIRQPLDTDSLILTFEQIRWTIPRLQALKSRLDPKERLDRHKKCLRNLVTAKLRSQKNRLRSSLMPPIAERPASAD